MSAAVPSIKTQELIGVDPIVLHFKPIVEKMTDEEFLEFCNLNDEWRFEVTSEGDLEMMLPTGTGTGYRNAMLIKALGVWAEADGAGVYFDSDTMFRLPNGAKRSPDMAWIRREGWDALSEEEQEGIAPLCPDFVVELRSRFDRLKKLQKKMQEYIDNGAQLGWLIDPRKKKVYIYRPGLSVEELDEPETLSGEPLLKGFVLPMAKFWRK